MRPIFFLAALAVVGAVGCGSSDRAPNVEGGGESAKGGKTSRGGSSGADPGGADSGGADPGGATGTDGGNAGAGGDSGGAAGSSSSTPAAPGAPIVTFVSPPSALDPNAAGVITTGEVTVACKATASTKPGSTVDPGSVLIKMSQKASGVTDDAPASTKMTDGARLSTFPLTAVESGEVFFTCTANDRSSPPLLGSADPLKLLIDRGPIVELAAPFLGEAIALNQGLDIAFTVTPSPLSSEDQKADITSVEVKINGRPVTVKEKTPGSGIYDGHVSLTDPNVFPASEQPNGASTLQILATNERGTVTAKSQTFDVDGTAPKITIIQPESTGKVVIVGANTQIVFTVVDENGAGTDPSSIAVKINSLPIFHYDPLQLSRWSHSATNTYSFTLSEADLKDSRAQATVQITASDKVGNTDSGQSLPLYLDFMPPIVNLDPPTVRERYFRSDLIMNDFVCSNAFDPLGDAVNDLEIVGDASYFRSLVWDDANDPGPRLPRYYAGTAKDKVWLYLQDDLTVPLLVDTDGDKGDGDGIPYCDDIDPGSATARKPPLQLKPITPSGTGPLVYASTEAGVLAADDTRYQAAPPVGPEICVLPGWDQSDETFRCNSHSDLVRVIKHEMEVTPPEQVIYGNNPTEGATTGCTGQFWEVRGLVSRTERDGWLCLAGLAYDNVGNRGVSPPLRICYDDPSTATVPDCAKNPVYAGTYNSLWESFIHKKGPSFDPIRARSSATPPSCTKSCKVRPQSIDRIVDL